MNEGLSVMKIVNWIVIGGAAQSRTGVQGFADLCVAAPPRRQIATPVFIKK